MNNLVALVGKPNVGKSTLFNKIIGKRQAIVYDQPGVTRDRLYQKVKWQNNNFVLIDTGGIAKENTNFLEQIRIQAQVAIEEAKLIIMVIDGTSELTKEDYFVIDLLRKFDKKVFVVANKLENNKDLDYSFYKLGVDKIFPISAIHGEGIGDLLDDVVSELDITEQEESDFFTLSIIGKPNAGKSSLLNKLANEDRSIVSDVAGTTRDSVNSFIDVNGTLMEIIDTAGINRKSKLVESVEHYALERAFNSLEEANLTLLILDATKELSHFDARIAGYSMENNKPIIIIVNKWDLIKKTTHTIDSFKEKIRHEFKFLSWAPILFLSALTGSRIDKLKDEILTVKSNLTKKIKTSLLNEIILEIQLMQPAQSFKGRRATITYAKQVDGKIPTFLFFVDHVENLHFTYKRYIENQLRDHFGFDGTPLNLIFRSKTNK